MTTDIGTAAAGTTQALSASDIQYFVELVNRKIGVQLQGKEYLIESRLQPVATKCGLASVGELMHRMRASDLKAQNDAIEAMTTNETSFFRDQHPFETLSKLVIPDLRSKSGGSLTVWNGACSSGQESYTLAITLKEHFPDLRSAQTKIVSTDVSPEMVTRCREGQYSRFEVNRGLPANLAVKYFDQVGRNWVAKQDLRSMIDARELNLLEQWVGLPKCDLVLLRNVLIYFTVPMKQQILRKIRTEVLKPGGCLLLGASETTVGIDAEYEGRHIGNSTFQFPKGQ